jgi:hypothetical protein
MPFHFCADELFMLLSVIPFIGVGFRKLHDWYHIRFKHEDHAESSTGEADETRTQV